MQKQNQERRQPPDISDLVPDTESKTISPTHLKTSAAAQQHTGPLQELTKSDPLQEPTKSAPIFSNSQNVEQSHETYISNQIREQLVQLGLSKEDIENKYERYIPAAARAIIEKSNEWEEALYPSIYRQLADGWEATVEEILGEMKNSNQGDVTLEQQSINTSGNHPICSTFTQTESTSAQDENFFTLAADPDMEPQIQSYHDLTEIEDTDLVSRSYVAETITQEELTKISDALVKAAALTTNKYRLNESISDISAAFCKLARVLDVTCSENEDYFLVLFEIWQNLIEK